MTTRYRTGRDGLRTIQGGAELLLRLDLAASEHLLTRAALACQNTAAFVPEKVWAVQHLRPAFAGAPRFAPSNKATLAFRAAKR